MKFASKLLTLFLFPAIGFAQQFNYSKIRTNSIDSLRKIENAKFITLSYSINLASDYFPNESQFSLAQPIIYQRKVNGFTIETSFYFSKPDSIVRLIQYEWGATDSHLLEYQQEGSEKSTDSQFNEIVMANKKIIADYFNFEPKEIPETEDMAAKSIWQNDSVYVELLVMPGLQRTRVLVSWK